MMGGFDNLTIEQLKAKANSLKKITFVLLVVMLFLLAVLAVNGIKLSKCESAYADGYNKCVGLCNAKLDQLQLRCPSTISEEETLPNLTSDVQIQIVN